MNKEEFLSELKKALAGLPEDEVNGRLSFYGEMIDDRMEEGLGESEAVAGIGSVDAVASQIVADIPLQKIVKERIKPKRSLRAWEVVLIVLGFPLWFPLLVAAGAVAFSLYIVVWSLIISLWAIELSLVVSAFAGVAAAVIYFVQGSAPRALAMLGAAFLAAGVSVFMFFGCVAASKGILALTKKAALGIKSMFIRKESSK